MNSDYLERILGFALLSHAEESSLARRWRESGDRGARDLLIQAHLRLVPPIAQRYYRSGALLGELVAEGNLGLLHASNKFEADRGYRFATYAKYWVRAYVSAWAARNSGWVIRQPRAVRRARREHVRATNLVGDDAEARLIVAARLQMSAGRVDELVGLSGQCQVSLEALHTESRSPGGLLCASEVSPEQAMLNEVERRWLEETVREAIAGLSAREQRIVDQRLMAEPEVTLTLHELALELGVSRERVRQLEVNLKRKLAIHLRGLSNGAEPRLPELAP